MKGNNIFITGALISVLTVSGMIWLIQEAKAELTFMKCVDTLVLDAGAELGDAYEICSIVLYGDRYIT